MHLVDFVLTLTALNGIWNYNFIFQQNNILGNLLTTLSICSLIYVVMRNKHVSSLTEDYKIERED